MSANNQPNAPLGSVLVTGGCGFLGSHIIELLLSRYNTPETQVHILDLRIGATTFPGAQYHTADITDAASLRPVLEKVRPNVIIHTVSPVFGSPANKEERQRAEAIMRKVNVDGTKLLMDEAKLVGCKAFVHTSSAGVVSDMRNALINADERWEYVKGKFQPEYYAETKAEGEEIVLDYNLRPTATSKDIFLTTALRPSGIFGERDVQMIPNMLKVARDGKTGFQLGSNTNLFDYTYVGNIAHAHVLAAAKLLELVKQYESSPPPPPAAVTAGKEGTTADISIDGEQFIITNQAPIPFWDFARRVWVLYAEQSPLNPPPAKGLNYWEIPEELAILLGTIIATIYSVFKLGQPRLSPTVVRVSTLPRYYRTTKARTVLGYTPIYTLSEGVDRSVKWFCEQERLEMSKKGQ